MPIPGSCVGVTAPLPVKACCRNFHLNKQAHKLDKRILGSVVDLITRIFRKISVTWNLLKSVSSSKQVPWNFIWINFAPSLGYKQCQDWDKKANKPWPTECSICKRCDIPPLLLSVISRNFVWVNFFEFVSFFLFSFRSSNMINTRLQICAGENQQTYQALIFLVWVSRRQYFFDRI